MKFCSVSMNILPYAQWVSIVFSKKVKKYSEKAEIKLTKENQERIIGKSEGGEANDLL